MTLHKEARASALHPLAKRAHHVPEPVLRVRGPEEVAVPRALLHQLPAVQRLGPAAAAVWGCSTPADAGMVVSQQAGAAAGAC